MKVPGNCGGVGGEAFASRTRARRRRPAAAAALESIMILTAVHVKPSGWVATRPSSWAEMHSDPRVGPHLAHSEAFQNIEQVMRHPPQGASWDPLRIQVGFNEEQNLYSIRLEKPTTPPLAGSVYYEFFITQKEH